MTEIPKDKISCKICKYRGESPISGTCEGCNYFSKFEIDYDKVCKWCYNPVADGDNICKFHREMHTKHSWPGCVESDKERRNKEEKVVATFTGERYDKTGKIRIMTSADGYCMCRRPGAIPFVVKIKEWEKLSTEPLNAKR